ncbi:hypothetical protein J437_LFUL013851 [Ladona fulva]|uniref:PEHE domain-containing protein n=1 Tax=Ladona fulva TaxID=123851 RepID=A0A8K0P8G6_LADFU|nr:hypothetical protein J437_LFUL013851 [Ladona fulva]
MSKLNGENTGVAGDFGAGSPVDMVTAIQEHISCTKEVDPFGSEDTKDDKIAYPCELDHMYASMTEAKALRDESNEMMHYKELVLIHLDLIQHQSEQIAMKDKELAALRQEVETLKQRLHRMDRRVTLQKHREVSDIGPLNCGSPAPGSPASPFGHNILPLSCSDGEVDEDLEVGNSSRSLAQSVVMVDTKPSVNLPPSIMQIPQVHTPNNTNTSITPLNSLSLKRKRIENGPCQEPDASVANRRRRRLASWSSDTPSSGTRRSGVTPLVDGATVPETQDTVESINRRSRVSGTPALQRSSKTPQIKVNQWESRSSRTRSSGVQVKKDAILVSSDHYYTPVGEEDFHWLNPAEELSKTSNTPGDVEVPSWRIRVCTSCYSMEGTENLGDDVFNKRHNRLEIDERRRKRWDIQRIREQRQYERLRQRESTCVKGGRGKRHSRTKRFSSTGSGLAGEDAGREEESSDVESFWPDSEDAKFLEVSNYVPVSAFGVPIVKFEPSDFSTSWPSPRGKAAGPVSNCSRRKYDGGRR